MDGIITKHWILNDDMKFESDFLIVGYSEYDFTFFLFYRNFFSQITITCLLERSKNWTGFRRKRRRKVAAGCG